MVRRRAGSHPIGARACNGRQARGARRAGLPMSNSKQAGLRTPTAFMTRSWFRQTFGAEVLVVTTIVMSTCQLFLQPYGTVV